MGATPCCASVAGRAFSGGYATAVIRLTRASLANRTVVVLVTVVLLVVGLVAAKALKQELIPSLDAPSASIVTVYAGAAPEVVEQ